MCLKQRSVQIMQTAEADLQGRQKSQHKVRTFSRNVRTLYILFMHFSPLSLSVPQIKILWYRWDQCDRPLSEPTLSIAPVPARVLLCKGAQDGRTSWNPSEDVFGLDHSAHRSSADSRSDTSYFISSFGLLPPHCAVINTGMGWPIFFSLLVP